MEKFIVIAVSGNTVDFFGLVIADDPTHASDLVKTKKSGEGLNFTPEKIMCFPLNDMQIIGILDGIKSVFMGSEKNIPGYRRTVTVKNTPENKQKASDNGMGYIESSTGKTAKILVGKSGRFKTPAQIKKELGVR